MSFSFHVNPIYYVCYNCICMRLYEKLICLNQNKYTNQLTVMSTIRGERRLAEGMCGKQIERTDGLT